MNCQQAQAWISLDIDGGLPPEAQKDLAEHCRTCEDCRNLAETARALHASFSQMELPPLPEGAEARLKQALAEENRKRPRRRPVYSHAWFKGLAAAACLLLLFGIGSVFYPFSGKGANDSAAFESANSAGPAASEEAPEMLTYKTELSQPAAEAQADGAYDADLPYDMEDAAAESEGGQANPALQRKIIQNVDLSLKVEDFDKAYQQLNDLAQKYEGYTVSGEVYTNENDIATSGFISLRVAADSLSQALDDIQQIGAVTDRQLSTEDITYQYYDTQSRLEQYRAQKERLLDFYQQAKNINDLLALEQELNRVQMELDALQGSIKYYDQLTALSLISIHLYTPSRYDVSVEPRGFAGFWRDLREAFFNGINGMLDFFAGLLLIIVRLFPLWILLALVLFLIFRRRRKKKAQTGGADRT
ncbi:MAG: DUF4349 domain-containing protein [Firmicutes bacterium]|nr:DUF4349 domain-containing protein [Bacillota bacterium]